jgi:hypothetical protein
MGVQKVRTPRARDKQEFSQTKYWSIDMANGWTSERKARQSALIRRWKPWEKSTGPKSPEGKARVARTHSRAGGANYLGSYRAHFENRKKGRSRMVE